MTGGGETLRARSIVYCVVPRDLARTLYEPLRDHFRAQANVEVVVERRGEDRRVRAERREATGDRRPDRRRVRSATGRRIDERRALTGRVSRAPALPRKARRHASRLVFLERLEPLSQQARDADAKRLVVRFQSGDKAAFSELYLRYFNAVYSYARVALSDHHEAEDTTQQVFMSALAALDRYELRASVPFRGWLFTIARNIVVRAVTLRSGLVVETPEQIDLLKEGPPEEPEPSVAETLDWLTDREVAMFVERLPLAQRQVLVLRFMLDLSSEETAQVLGRSSTAVRKLQSRALQALQRRLAAVGRTSSKGGPVPVRRRLGTHTVMARRRFALTHSRGTPGVTA